MTELELWTLWRGLNASLALMAFLLVMLNGVIPKFRKVSHEVQLMMLTTLALLLTSVVGSVEQALTPTPPGMRVPLLTAALLWAILAMTVFKDEDQGRKR